MSTNQYVPGLEGVIAAQTGISLVDGNNGRLVYRGHWAKELAERHCFEEAAYLLWHGRLPDNRELKELKEALRTHRVLSADTLRLIEVLPLEHGLNASTFAARVVTSTASDLVSAVCAAIGAMKGPLHGGAPSEVLYMLEDIGNKSNAEPWLRERLERGERLMGFGHRVYKTRDPRAEALRTVTATLTQGDPWLDLAVYVEETAIRLLQEYKPGRRLYTNVEFFAAAVMRSVSMPAELFTPTFTASRMVGWTAHIAEQAANNRIFRPQSTYIGALPELCNS